MFAVGLFNPLILVNWIGLDLCNSCNKIEKYQMGVMDQANNVFQMADDVMNMNIRVLRDTAPRVVLDLPNARQQYQNAVMEINRIVDVVSKFHNDLKDYMNNLYVRQSQSIDTVNSIDAGIGSLEKEVEDTRILNEVRKEQAAELKRKTVGNLHSSWLGLWKPLSDEFRVGLAIFSLGLLMVSFVIVAFLIYEGLISIPALPFFSTQSLYTRT